MIRKIKVSGTFSLTCVFKKRKRQLCNRHCQTGRLLTTPALFPSDALPWKTSVVQGFVKADASTAICSYRLRTYI